MIFYLYAYVFPKYCLRIEAYNSTHYYEAPYDTYSTEHAHSSAKHN